MKTFARFLALAAMALFVATSQSTGQTGEYCGFDEGQQAPLTQLGGAYMPSFGTIRALMVFIDFSDDTTDVLNQTWPVGTGPGYLSSIIDVNEGSPSGTVANITTYFRNMSFTNLRIIGTAVYRQARNPLAWYNAHPTYRFNVPYWATRHVIEHMDTTGFDFSPYDLWKRISVYNLQNIPDGVVDMIFACYRKWYSGSGFIAEGWADLGAGGTFPVDNGQRFVQTGYPAWGNDGSGVTVVKMIEYAPNNPRLEHVEHEFGHYLGLPHNYSGGLWSLMGHRHPNISSFMNAYEREQLGWISYTDVTTNGQTATISDFGTTGVAYRVTIPGGESFLVENHQLFSPYDLVDLTGGAGLYILQRHSSNLLRVVAADGRWNWSNPYWIPNPFGGGTIPVYKREQINRNLGYTDKVDIPHSQNGTGLMHAWLDEHTGALKTGPRYKGDGKDRFTFAENNMFSPWSAYAAYNWNGTSTTTVGVEITGTSGSNINVKFYTTTPASGPPSKPQDLRISTSNGHPRLTWTLNGEPDVNPTGNYLIHRRIRTSGWGNWSLLATVSGSTAQYVDESLGGAPNGPDSVQYKIQARDVAGTLSVFSNIVSTMFTTFIDRPTPVERRSPVPDRFALMQNIPNPFNPTTLIRYQMPYAAHITLKLYDVLGEEIGTLIDEVKPMGYHEFALDASMLASGVYFYKMVAGEYVAAKKLVVIK